MILAEALAQSLQRRHRHTECIFRFDAITRHAFARGLGAFLLQPLEDFFHIHRWNFPCGLCAPTHRESNACRIGATPTIVAMFPGRA